MKQLSLFLSMILLSSAPAFAEGWRCWADPGFDGVVKIDVDHSRICVTGFDGKDYSCENRQGLPLVSRSDVTVDTYGEPVPAVSFLARSADGKAEVEITVLNQAFPRPYFPQFQVSPANIRNTSGVVPYQTFTWTRRPDGKFADGEFYCLSERYFP